MPIEFYRFLHIIGILFLIAGFGVLTLGFHQHKEIPQPWKKIGFISHGIGFLVILISGFGMLAKLGMMSGFPVWVMIKIGIWLALGASVVRLKKKRELAPIFLLVAIALASVSAYYGIFKPI